MKKLTYIKLFEAFESVKLSKTLGYIKTGKENFLSQLKSICNSLDLPYSKLSDEYFEYLSFSKALKKADIITDEKCTATSADSYPQYAVDGEVCTKGQVKRTWGRGVRLAKCEICGGTGVKRKKEGDVKLVKFWFTKDGDFVYSSAVDGIIRPSISTDGLSTSLRNYEDKTDWLSTREFLRQAEHGDFAIVKISGIDTVSYIYKAGGRIYALQNQHSGSTPNGTEWRKIARYGWSIGGGEFQGGKILRLKAKKKKDEEVDPFTWNIGLDIGGRSLMINKRIDLQSKLSDANFALVLDFGKLKGSEYKKSSELSSERGELKKGSKLEWDDDKIRKQNIDRYMSELAKNLDIADNVSNINKLVKRILGFKYALYTNISTDVKEKLNGIIRRYYTLLKATGDYEKESALRNLNDYVDSTFRSSMSVTKNISNSIKEIRSSVNDDKLEVLNKLDEISNIIYNKISDFDIETIEDLEVIHQKMLAVKNVFSTERYPAVKRMEYFFYYLGDSSITRPLRYINDVNSDLVIKDLERIKRIIERL